VVTRFRIDNQSVTISSTHFVPIKTDAEIKGIGDLQLDDGSPLVISVVADDAAHFTIQHPEVLYAQNLEFPIMLMGLCIQRGIHFHLCAQGLYQPKMTLPDGFNVNLLHDRRTGFFWLVEHTDAEPTLSMHLRIGREAVLVGHLGQDDIDKFAPLSSAETAPTHPYFPSGDNALHDFSAPAREQRGGGNGADAENAAAAGSAATKRGKQAEQQINCSLVPYPKVGGHHSLGTTFLGSEGGWSGTHCGDIWEPQRKKCNVRL